jgi:zinc protease
MRDLHVSTLPNGLRLMVLESHAAPVATFWVWYRVGSRNEPVGCTGISHWVEHLLFKGTPSHQGGTLTRLIDRLGGRWNAFTWKDYTAYYELMPAAHLDVAIRLEADRMQNTIFDPDVIASERTVIISEREGAENYPSYYLREEVDALAFKAHPYRQPVIGWKDDLRVISRDDLYGHYRAYYHPSNAVAIAVGDVGARAVTAQIADAFGPIPAGPAPPAVRSIEPEQSGERRVVLRRPGGATAYLHMAYHVPAASHPDLPALLVLDGVLSGFSGPAPFDGGGGGRSSRLYRALVDGGLAADVGSGLVPSIDPTVFRISATVRSGVDVANVEHVIDAEIARLHERPVDDAELASVKRQARSQFVYLNDGVSRRAVTLGAFATVASLQTLFGLAEAVEGVTALDVTRVAQAYLLQRSRTVGWFLPEQGADRREAQG